MILRLLSICHHFNKLSSVYFPFFSFSFRFFFFLKWWKKPSSREWNRQSALLDGWQQKKCTNVGLTPASIMILLPLFFFFCSRPSQKDRPFRWDVHPQMCCRQVKSMLPKFRSFGRRKKWTISVLHSSATGYVSTSISYASAMWRTRLGNPAIRFPTERKYPSQPFFLFPPVELYIFIFFLKRKASHPAPWHFEPKKILIFCSSGKLSESYSRNYIYFWAQVSPLKQPEFFAVSWYPKNWRKKYIARNLLYRCLGAWSEYSSTRSGKKFE